MPAPRGIQAPPIQRGGWLDGVPLPHIHIKAIIVGRKIRKRKNLGIEMTGVGIV